MTCAPGLHVSSLCSINTYCNFSDLTPPVRGPLHQQIFQADGSQAAAAVPLATLVPLACGTGRKPRWAPPSWTRKGGSVPRKAGLWGDTRGCPPGSQASSARDCKGLFVCPLRHNSIHSCCNFILLVSSYCLKCKSVTLLLKRLRWLPIALGLTYKPCLPL